MKDKILQTLKQFLQERGTISRPLLLGFSGGPDSLALFHLLLEVKKSLPFSLHVAHVDHGWREESGKEAVFLEKYVMNLGASFHLKKLIKCETEHKAREERLAFFSLLYQQLGCQALLLGHQRDDQSETVLKRILEGAHLTALGGILDVSDLKGMSVWRPLLKYRKKDIYEWLKRKGLHPLEDPTNQDPKFLRSRMRTQIFPELSKKFGKEINENLCKIAEVARELTDYLDLKIKPYNDLVQKQAGSLRIDFNSLSFFEPVEVKAFLKRVVEKENIALSHEALATLYQLIKTGACRKKILAGKKIIEIHNRVVAIKNNDSYELK